MSNISGYKRVKTRKAKLTKLIKHNLFEQQQAYYASQRIEANAKAADSILDWDLLNILQFSFNLTEVHYKPTQDNINTICNKIEAQRLIIEPTSIMLMNSAVNFYKDNQEYFVIAGKDIILDDLKHKLLKDILKDK